MLAPTLSSLSKLKAPNSCKLFKTSFLSSSFNSGTLKITVPSSEI
jgi:hypothetical protein